MNAKRLKPADRKAAILENALELAIAGNYQRVTRDQIAAAGGHGSPLVQHYFGTMLKLRRAVMRAAIQRKCLPVIAQGIMAKDRYALKAPVELREAALQNLIEENRKKSLQLPTA